MEITKSWSNRIVIISSFCINSKLYISGYLAKQDGIRSKSNSVKVLMMFIKFLGFHAKSLFFFEGGLFLVCFLTKMWSVLVCLTDF